MKSFELLLKILKVTKHLVEKAQVAGFILDNLPVRQLQGVFAQYGCRGVQVVRVSEQGYNAIIPRASLFRARLEDTLKSSMIYHKVFVCTEDAGLFRKRPIRHHPAVHKKVFG